MKRTVKLLILLAIISMILLIANSSQAATTLKYTDTEQNIEWTYELDKDGNITKLVCATKSVIGKVKIPSTIDGKPVTRLDSTFKDCPGLTEVEFSDNIVTIGEYAFQDCAGLKSMTIPNSIISIGRYAFKGCLGLKEVKFSTSLTTIGDDAFSNCKGLTSITIPDTVIKLGESAFYGCSGLKEVNLSKNLSIIEQRTFEGCTGLTEIKLPESVTTIGGSNTWSNIYGAFENCKNLKKILIPDSVATIYKTAFYGHNENLTIYGHDNQESKRYAEENKIKFDYIENWDKADIGDDVSKPRVSKIVVPYANYNKYNKSNNTYMVPTNTQLALRVDFSEIINGSKVPTLTIKFGNGNSIKLEEGTITGNSITYLYKVQSSDKGTLTAVSFTGGNITDVNGNEAELSCPEIRLENEITKSYIYANGTGVEDSNNNNNNNQNGSNNNGTSNGNNNNASNNNNGNDGTTAKKDIPQTGVEYGVVVAIAAVLAIGSFTFIKLNKSRDIK